MTRSPSTFVIGLTTFDADERFDEDAYRAHLRRLATAGIGVYVGGAGSGEGYTLSEDENQRLLGIAVAELKGKVPVRAMGVEPRTADQMIGFAKLAAEAGVDAFQLYSLDIGHMGQPEGAEIERYLCDVLSATHLPAVISTHYSVGYLIPVPVLRRVTERFDHVIGINCTTTDSTYLVQLIDAVDDRIDVHVGIFQQALLAFSLGASGFLSTEGNVVPRLCVSIVDRYRAGDLTGTVDAFGRLARLSARLYSGGGGIRITKAALEILGLPGGIPRRPRLPLQDAEVRSRIAAVLDELGVPELVR